MINLKEILYDYAYTKGGGLPLTPQEMCNAVVQWVQKYLEDEKDVEELRNQDNLVLLVKTTNDSGYVIYNINLDIDRLVSELNNQFTADNFLDAFTLNEKIVGSDSVVVDISEDNKKLVIKLDQTLSDTIKRLDEKAILKPDSLTEESVPVVNIEGAVSYKPVSELGGGNIYQHEIIFNISGQYSFIFYSTNGTPINDYETIYNKFRSERRLGIAFGSLGNGVVYIYFNTNNSIVIKGICNSFSGSDIISINSVINISEVSSIVDRVTQL